MDEGVEQDQFFADDDVGARLRLAREEQGLTIADVAERTRIPRRHLALIEEGDFAGLPAPTYSVGFVKTYAQLLGLDGIDLSQRFRRALAYAVPSPAPATAFEPADPPPTPTRAIAWTCFALALLLVGGYLYWRGTSAESDGLRLAAQTDDRPAATAPPPHAIPAPAAPVAVATPAAAAGAVLTATSAVWIKVYEMGGATLKLGVLQPGETYQVPADAVDPRLVTGRPNALDVRVNGQAIPALGPPERRIADVSLKPAALIARAAPSGAIPALPAATVPAAGNEAAPQ